MQIHKSFFGFFFQLQLPWITLEFSGSWSFFWSLGIISNPIISPCKSKILIVEFYPLQIMVILSTSLIINVEDVKAILSVSLSFLCWLKVSLFSPFLLVGRWVMINPSTLRSNNFLLSYRESANSWKVFSSIWNLWTLSLGKEIQEHIWAHIVAGTKNVKSIIDGAQAPLQARAILRMQISFLLCFYLSLDICMLK